MLSKVLSVLEDEDSYVRQCALEMYTTLVEYGKFPTCLPIQWADHQPVDVRAFICSGETIYKVIDMLADTDLDVQQRALGLATTLAHYSE